MERNKTMMDFAILCHDMDADDSGFSLGGVTPNKYCLTKCSC